MKLYSSIAVFEWYKHAFSKEKLGDRAIEPGDIRFSMNDISRNFINIPAVDFEKIIDTLVKEFDENSGQTYVKIDRKELSCDMGYGMEAIKFFADILKNRLTGKMIDTEMQYVWKEYEDEEE